VIYFCCDELRRAALADPTKKSLWTERQFDFLEVLIANCHLTKKLMRQRLFGAAFCQQSYWRAVDRKECAHRRRRTHQRCDCNKRDARSRDERAHD